ncbi:sphinganine kinase lcb4 [Tulasnella sp. 418]|nr:sphinganine kinase lcb4 [Tulasnella sp. 418]
MATTSTFNSNTLPRSKGKDASGVRRSVSISALRKSFMRPKTADSVRAVTPFRESQDIAEASPSAGELSSSATSTTKQLLITLDGKKAVLKFTHETFSVHLLGTNGQELETRLSTAVMHVLDVRTTASSESEGKNAIAISTLARKNKKLVLVKIEAIVDEEQAKMNEWVNQIMEVAYAGVRPRRNFKVFVNPVGGKGNARSLFENRVNPVFTAARCTLDVTYTTHHGHASELAMTLPLTYDGVITVSGDGLVYEIINGFAKRLDARETFTKLPIVPVPAGSGNAMSLNLLGAEDGLDVVMATLNAIKGKLLCLDMASITNLGSKETTYSFLTQAGGLMAELDIGTEDLRWMGDTRFVVGFLKGLFYNTPRPLKITIRGEEVNRPEALASFLSAEETNPVNSVTPTTPPSLSMPPVRYLGEDDSQDGWITFDKPILYVYGGLMPYVSRDLLEFPLKKPGDEKIHLIIQEIEKRSLMVSMLDGSAEGDAFFLPTHNYYSASAYRIVPAGPTPKNRAYFSFDGERAPFEGFHMEAHKGLMHTLSMKGKFVIPEKFGKEGKKFGVRP